MKKIIYIHQYYRRPDEPGTSRSHWIAKYLANKGYEVVMITQKNSFNSENRNAPLIERVNCDDFQVIYIRNSYSNEFSIIRRLFSFIYFTVLSTYFALKEKNVSLLIASSTPISVGVPAFARRLLKKTPYIFEVRDLWPEIPIEMGVIKNDTIIKFSKKYIRSVYGNASHIIALSPGMKDGILEYKPSLNVTMIPNMSKIDFFSPGETDQSLNKELGLSETSFKVIHFGTMGNVNGLENYVESALLAKNKQYTDIDFILVGSGKFKHHFREFQKKNQIENLRIYDRMPLEKISRLVTNCDVSYIGVTKYKILEDNSANKFFDSLAAGKPIIINFGGWLEEIIVKEECGLRVDNTNPASLLNALLYLKENEQERIKMGKNGRNLAIERYDKEILCEDFYNIVRSICELR